MVRGGSSCRIVRLDRWAYYGDHVILANVGYQDIKDSLLVCRARDYLEEAWVNIKETLYVEIILITSQYEGRVLVLGFQAEIVETYMFNQGRLFPAVRWEVKCADYNALDMA